MKARTSLAIRAFVVLALLFTSWAAFGFYDPAIQRWINRDQLNDAELLPEGPNLFSIVRNNPLNTVDPDGTASISTPAGQEALVIAIGEEAAAQLIGPALARAAAARIAARAAACGLGARTGAKCLAEYIKHQNYLLQRKRHAGHLCMKTS